MDRPSKWNVYRWVETLGPRHTKPARSQPNGIIIFQAALGDCWCWQQRRRRPWWWSNMTMTLTFLTWTYYTRIFINNSTPSKPPWVEHLLRPSPTFFHLFINVLLTLQLFTNTLLWYMYINKWEQKIGKQNLASGPFGHQVVSIIEMLLVISISSINTRWRWCFGWLWLASINNIWIRCIWSSRINAKASCFDTKTSSIDSYMVSGLSAHTLIVLISILDSS